MFTSTDPSELFFKNIFKLKSKQNIFRPKCRAWSSQFVNCQKDVSTYWKMPLQVLNQFEISIISKYTININISKYNLFLYLDIVEIISNSNTYQFERRSECRISLRQKSKMITLSKVWSLRQKSLTSTSNFHSKIWLSAKWFLTKWSSPISFLNS